MWTERALVGCLVIVGLINVVPVAGILSAGNLEQAYAISIEGADLEILMRHRALLFGILGGFVLYAAFVDRYRNAAMIMAGISMVGFAALTWSVGSYNESLGGVLAIDLVGVLFLTIAVLLRMLMRGQ